MVDKHPSCADRADVHAVCMQTTYTACMAAKIIQIRNVPPEVHRTLRTRAAAAGQSLSAYLLSEITQLADRPTVAEVLARARLRGPGASTEAIVKAVRSGRDRL